jgi:SAM-dependent methyltransferase
MNSKDFYNGIARHYNDYCKESGINDFLHLEMNLVSTSSPHSILEIGVGTGRFANAYLVQYPAVSYTGIDNASEMLNGITNKNIQIVHQDAVTYTRECVNNNRTYDCIILMYSTIHHFTNKEQLVLFTETKKLTKRIIINCLTEQEETILFRGDKKASVAYIMPNERKNVTTVHKVHETLRKEMTPSPEGGRRHFLVWERVT